MSQDISRLAKNTLALFVRTFVTMGISLYTSRVILKVLGVEDFGVYGVVGGIIWMFSFLSNSMAGATQRFLTIEIGKNNLDLAKRTFDVSLLIYIALSIIIVIIGETVGLWFVKNKIIVAPDRMDAALWVYQASIVTAVITIISIPYNALIISYEKMSAFAYISIYETAAKLGVVFLVELLNFDKLKAYAILLLVVQISIRVIYQIYCGKYFAIAKFNWKLTWHPLTIKSMVRFAGWTLFGNLSCIAYTQGINIVLNMFFGPVVNAARSIAAQVETVVKSFVSGFQTAINPQLVKNYASDNVRELHRLIFAGCKFSFFLLYVLCLPVFLEASAILNVWLVSVPPHTINFIRIIIMAILIETQSNALSTSVGATGNIKNFQIIIGGILLLILPCVYFNLRAGGSPETAMLIYLFFIFLAQMARLWMSRRLINLSIRAYVRRVVIPICGVVFCSAIIPVFIQLFLPSSVGRVVIIGVVSFLLTCLSIYWIGLTIGERGFILQKLTIVYSRMKKIKYVAS